MTARVDPDPWCRAAALLQSPQGGLPIARFFYSDPMALRSAMEQLLSRTAGPGDTETPIPVDVYQDGNEIVIEGALPGARLEDLELTCEEGLLTVRGRIERPRRDYAVQELPAGSFSRTLALPVDCHVEQARASFQDGILRIVLPRTRATVTRSIRIETPSQSRESSRIVMQKPEADVVEAVKGEDYKDVESKPPRRRGRSGR